MNLTSEEKRMMYRLINDEILNLECFEMDEAEEEYWRALKDMRKKILDIDRVEVER